MRVTTGPSKHADGSDPWPMRPVSALVVGAIVLSSLLLLLVLVGVPGNRGPSRTVVGTGATPAVTGDGGYVNPWEVGNAAAREALAEEGRTCR